MNLNEVLRSQYYRYLSKAAFQIGGGKMDDLVIYVTAMF